MTQSQASTFTFLGNGDAVSCALKGNLNTTGHLSAFFYSPNGSLIKTVELASTQNIFDGNFEDDCRVVSTGTAAAIVWAVPAAISAPHQPGRQLLVSRILPGLKLATPVPALPAGDDQLSGTSGSAQETIAITKTGWIALAWPYIKISKLTQTSITFVTQWRARWVSPADALGAVVPLEKQRGETCRLACDGLETTFYLGAIGDQKAMVVDDTKGSWGTLDTAGAVSARTPLPSPHFLGSTVGLMMSFGDYKAVTAWTSGSFTGNNVAAASAWSRGRWSAPHDLARGHGSNRLDVSQALMSQHGQGCVISYRLTALGFGAGVYAEFDS